jgi:hypothetical protein
MRHFVRQLAADSFVRIWFGLSIASAAFALAALVGGCSLPPMDTWIYVDNSLEEPLVVLVDGQERVTIEPGLSATLEYPPGEYHFVVKAGDRVLLDERKKLEETDSFGPRRKLLLNPDAETKYQIYVMQYGQSRLGDAMESGLLSMQKDPQARNQYLYKQLLKDLTLVPQGTWSEVTGSEYVLKLPPDSVVSKSAIEKKKVVARIDAKDYARMQRAGRKERPTERDVEALADLLDDIVAKALAGPRTSDLAERD